MKKLNPNNKLAFNKGAVAELNETQLKDVNGGGGSNTTLLPTIIITFFPDEY